METSFRHGKSLNTCARVLQNVLKPHVNERVSEFVFEYLFLQGT
jgi:hypothetical protein